MQERFRQQKMKKEHWQNVHHELMESSAERFEQIELSNDSHYNCVDCLDTKECTIFGVCSKCHVPATIAKQNPNDKIKVFNKEMESNKWI